MSVYLYWCYTITSAVLNSSLFIVRDFRYKKWNHIKRDTNYTAKSFISIYLLNTPIKVHGPLGGKVHSSVCRCMTVRVLRCWRWTVWWARAGHSQTQDSAHSPLRESHLKYKQKNVSYLKKNLTKRICPNLKRIFQRWARGWGQFCCKCYLQWTGAPHVERQTYGRYPLHLETEIWHIMFTEVWV